MGSHPDSAFAPMRDHAATEAMLHGWRTPTSPRPGPGVDIVLGQFEASRRGEFAAVDPTLERLLGRPPLTVRDVLSAQLVP